MVTKVLMPKPGWITEEGTVIGWFKKEGDRVEKGQPLLEVETEKVTTEVEAPASGILRRILVPTGSVVPVFSPVAIIGDPDEELPEIGAIPEEAERVRIEPRKEVTEIVKEPRPAERLLISPLARKLAEETMIDTAQVKGTGPGGRIVKEDVLKAAESRAETLPMKGFPAKVIPMVGKRKAIAERMAHSARTTAHCTITTEVNASELVKYRNMLLPQFEKAGLDLTYTDLLVKAVAMALEEHPLLNSVYVEDQIRMFDDINIGVAVVVEDGLIVPVVHRANGKTLREIALLLKQLATKAREGTLSTEEVTGGTFTITNLGMFGVDTFTPIIHPPENAILGVGRIVVKPIVVNGDFVAASTIPLSLTFDHRIMDGVPAAKLLQSLKKFVENPDLLLAEKTGRSSHEEPQVEQFRDNSPRTSQNLHS
jgi:pyruvate dehydrogenase E2 component (dihydrolipoamide acetyltransferase)